MSREYDPYKKNRRFVGFLLLEEIGDFGQVAFTLV